MREIQVELGAEPYITFIGEAARMHILTWVGGYLVVSGALSWWAGGVLMRARSTLHPPRPRRQLVHYDHAE